MAASTIRPATLEDAPVMRAVLFATVPDDDPPAAPEPLDAYFRHLVARGVVAVAEDGGSPVGFAAAVDTGRSRHLADLFVLPDRQSHGIGRRLLDAVYEDAWPRTTFGSADPRAVPLYIRAGMGAYWPNLYLSGDPAALPPIADDLAVEDASGADVAALEVDWIGADRSPDLAYWASLPGIRIVVIRRGARVVGTALARERFNGVGRWMHHAVAAPDVDGLPILLAAMRACLEGTEIGGGCIPGPAPLVRELLQVGFRIVDRDTFLASDPSIVDPHREIVNTGFL
jgi:GNAT superfamily N-acetyltransferase